MTSELFNIIKTEIAFYSEYIEKESIDYSFIVDYLPSRTEFFRFHDILYLKLNETKHIEDLLDCIITKKTNKLYVNLTKNLKLTLEDAIKLSNKGNIEKILKSQIKTIVSKQLLTTLKITKKTINRKLTTFSGKEVLISSAYRENINNAHAYLKTHNSNNIRTKKIIDIIN